MIFLSGAFDVNGAFNSNHSAHSCGAMSKSVLEINFPVVPKWLIIWHFRETWKKTKKSMLILTQIDLFVSQQIFNKIF